MTLKTLLRYAVVLIVVYLAAWAASYVIVFVSRGDGLDFTHCFEYFELAWTFRGGELPSIIQLFSIVVYLPLAAAAVFLLRGYERHKKLVA